MKHILFFLKHPRITLSITSVLLFLATFGVFGVYFLSKYWFPPVTAYPAAEVGSIATIKTNRGDIVVALSGTREAVAQFTNFAKNGFYTNTHIHRVVPKLLIEMGDPLTKDERLKHIWGQGSSVGIFENQTSKSDTFTRGTVAMSGSKYGTYGSQFFISTNSTSWLSGKHTIIGNISSGMDVVAEIEKSSIDSFSKPIEPITIYEVIIQ